MKFFPPFALAILLTACAITPEDQKAARQHQLEKEARQNFIALKSQEHPGRPVVMHDDAPPPTPKPSLIPFLGWGQPAATPAPAPTPRAKATRPAPEPPQPQPALAAAPKFKPTPKPAPMAMAKSKPGQPPKPTPKPKPKPQNKGDTLYFWQVQSAPANPKQHLRFQAAEAKYAGVLAKRLEDLTPEERLYAHEHF